jgi:hypothetical protein
MRHSEEKKLMLPICEKDLPKWTLPSWKVYLSFWNKHYPDLLVSKPAADICSHCYKLYNRHKFSKGELSDE